MSKFKPGTRVKKVRGGDCDGITGVVFQAEPEFPYDFCFVIDVFSINKPGEIFNPGYECDGFSKDFEAIVPDGHRAAEESLEELLPFLKEQKVTA